METAKIDRLSFISIMMLVTIMVLIIILVILVKNINLITSDPINYGMKEHGFISCTCKDVNNDEWLSTEKGFILQKQIQWDKMKS